MVTKITVPEQSGTPETTMKKLSGNLVLFVVGMLVQIQSYFFRF
jgi:hypothetical protein